MNKQQEPRLRFKGFTGKWECKKLGEISTSYSGGTPIVSNAKFYGGTIPFIRSGEIHSSKTELFLTQEGFENSSTKLVKKGDILYALYGATSGEVGRSQIDGAINQAILAIIPKENYKAEFISQWLKINKENIVSLYLQGGQGNLSGEIVKKIEISFPSPKEQTHLGNFFRRLDSQIAESCAVLEKSRQLKKAMLAKMFPANGEKIPKIRFKGFEGEWKEKSLGELVEQIKSYPLSRNVETSENTGFKYIHYGDIHRGIADIIYSDEVLPNIQAGNFELLKRGDLIIADVSEDYDGVGAACVIDGPLKDKVVSGLHTIAIRPNQTNSLFLYYLLKTQAFKQYGRLIGTGTKVVGITASKFLNFQTYIPTVLEQTAIGNFFCQLDETIALQSAEVEKLNQLKKGLLAAMLV